MTALLSASLTSTLTAVGACYSHGHDLDSVLLTLSPAAELDGDLLVHVLAQIQDVLFLRPLSLLLPRRISTLCASSSTTSSAAMVAATTTASSPSECAALRHIVRDW